MKHHRQSSILVGGITILALIAIAFIFPEIDPSRLSGHIDLSLDDDLDGLSNFEEQEYTMTDPNEADTDGDGAKDGFEVYVRESDPLSP